MGNTSTKQSTTTSEDRFISRPRRRSLRNSLRFSKTSSRDVLSSADKYLQSLNEDFEKGVLYHKNLSDLKKIENDLHEILTDLQNLAKVGNTSSKRFELENTARYLRNKLKSTIDNHMGNAISKLNEVTNETEDQSNTTENPNVVVEAQSIQVVTDPEIISTKLRELSIKIRELLIFLSSLVEMDDITRYSIETTIEKCKSELYSIQTKNEKLLHKRDKCLRRIEEIKFILRNKKFPESEEVMKPSEQANMPNSLGRAIFYDNEMQNSDSDACAVEADAEDSAEETQKKQQFKKVDGASVESNDSETNKKHVAQVHIADDQEKNNEEKIKSVKAIVKNLDAFVSSLENVDEATMISSEETLKNCKEQLRSLKITNSMLAKKRVRRLKEIDDLRATIHEKHCDNSNDDCSYSSGKDDSQFKQIQSGKNSVSTKDEVENYVGKAIKPNNTEEDRERIFPNAIPDNEHTTIPLAKKFNNTRRRIDDILVRKSASFDDLEALREGICEINNEFNSILRKIIGIEEMEEDDIVNYKIEPQRRHAKSKVPDQTDSTNEKTEQKPTCIKQYNVVCNPASYSGLEMSNIAQRKINHEGEVPRRNATSETSNQSKIIGEKTELEPSFIGQNNEMITTATCPVNVLNDPQKKGDNVFEKPNKTFLDRSPADHLLLNNTNILEEGNTSEAPNQENFSEEKTQMKSAPIEQNNQTIFIATYPEFVMNDFQKAENNVCDEPNKVLLGRSSPNVLLLDDATTVEERNTTSKTTNQPNNFEEDMQIKPMFMEQKIETIAITTCPEFVMNDPQEKMKKGYIAKQPNKAMVLETSFDRSSPDLWLRDVANTADDQDNVVTDIIRCMSESSSKKMRIKSAPNDAQTQSQSVSGHLSVRKTQYKTSSEHDFNKMLANTKDNLISMRNIDLSMINSGDMRISSTGELERSDNANTFSTRNIDLSQISRDSDLSLIGQRYSYDGDRQISIGESMSHLTADEYSTEDGIVITFTRESKRTESSESTSTTKEMIQSSYEVETLKTDKTGSEEMIDIIEGAVPEKYEKIKIAEDRLSVLKEKIMNFIGLKTDDLYNELDEELVQIMLIVDELALDESDPLFLKKEGIVKNIYKYSGILEMKSLDHAFLDSFEGEITLVEKEMKHYLATQKLENLKHIVQDIDDMIVEMEQKGIDHLLMDRRDACIKRLKGIKDNLNIMLK